MHSTLSLSLLFTHLHEHTRPIHVRRQDQTPRNGQGHGICRRRTQPAPPETGFGRLERDRIPGRPLHEAQQAGVGGQDGGSQAFRARPPVRGGVAVAPGRGAVGLIVQVRPKHVPGVGVAPGDRLPGLDDALLRPRPRHVPQLRDGGGRRLHVVAVQQDEDAPAGRGAHDGVQLGARRQALEGRVAAAEVGGFDRVQLFHQLDGEGQAQGVEAVVRHEVHDLVERAAPEAVQDAVGRLQAKPVDAWGSRRERGRREMGAMEDRVSARVVRVSGGALWWERWGRALVGALGARFVRSAGGALW